MNAPDLNRQPYRRPPMARATDPQRMNWLWRLFCEVADIRPAEVVEALHTMQIPVDQQRVRSWIVSDRDDSFFPVSIAEVERNLRALLVLRTAKRKEEDESGKDSMAGAPSEDTEVDFDDDDFAAPEIDVAEDDVSESATPADHEPSSATVQAAKSEA